MGSTNNVVDLIDATGDNYNTETKIEPKVEDVPMDDVIEERETAQAQTVKYGRGMRI